MEIIIITHRIISPIVWPYMNRAWLKVNKPKTHYTFEGQCIFTRSYHHMRQKFNDEEV